MSYLKKVLEALRGSPLPDNGRYWNISRDIEMLMKEDGMSYEEAYEALAVYLSEEDYVDFQSVRGTSEKIARSTFRKRGPLLNPIKLLNLNFL